MKPGSLIRTLLLTTAVCTISPAQTVIAQGPPKESETSAVKPEAPSKDKTDGEKTSPPPEEVPKDPAEREKAFIKTLTKATLNGRWCLIREGKLTPERDDKYTIESVAKQDDGTWVVNARIQYNDTDILFPVPVNVEWAGDAPIIIVDNLQIPGGNTYSARVLIHADTYAGTWSGTRLKGLLNGVITRKE